MVQDGDKNSPSRKEDQNVPASEKSGSQYGMDKRCARSLPWSKAAQKVMEAEDGIDGTAYGSAPRKP